MGKGEKGNRLTVRATPLPGAVSPHSGHHWATPRCRCCATARSCWCSAGDIHGAPGSRHSHRPSSASTAQEGISAAVASSRMPVDQRAGRTF